MNIRIREWKMSECLQNYGEKVACASLSMATTLDKPTSFEVDIVIPREKWRVIRPQQRIYGKRKYWKLQNGWTGVIAQEISAQRQLKCVVSFKNNNVYRSAGAKFFLSIEGFCRQCGVTIQCNLSKEPAEDDDDIILKCHIRGMTLEPHADDPPKRQHEQTCLDDCLESTIMNDSKSEHIAVPLNGDLTEGVCMIHQKCARSVGSSDPMYEKVHKLRYFTPNDSINDAKIVGATKAYRNLYNHDSMKHRNYDYKMMNNTSKLVERGGNMHTGEGMSKYKLTRQENSFEYSYWDDPNELVDQLRLLLASQAAGNSFLSGDIISIIEKLRVAKIIY